MRRWYQFDTNLSLPIRDHVIGPAPVPSGVVSDGNWRRFERSAV